jgi:hypothetical protein
MVDVACEEPDEEHDNTNSDISGNVPLLLGILVSSRLLGRLSSLLLILVSTLSSCGLLFNLSLAH